MRLQEVFERHPLFTAGSSVVTVAGITASVVMFFMDHKVDAVRASEQMRHQQLVQRMSTIQRRVGKDADYLNVQNIPVSQREAPSDLDGLHFYQGDRFYAPDGEAEGWVHAQPTEFEFASYLIGADQQELQAQMDPAQLQIMQSAPVHVWYRPDTYEFNDVAGLKQIFPFVLLQRISHSKVRNLLKGQLTASPEAEQLAAGLEGHYDGDATGLMLSFLLLQEFVGVDGQATTQLERLQKQGNCVYAQLMTTLHNVEVNGQTQPHFYLLREFLLISTDEDLYIVKTTVPMPEGSAATDATRWVGSWMNQLRILTGVPTRLANRP